MIASLAKTIFGSSNDRYVRSLGKYVDATNAFDRGESVSPWQTQNSTYGF